MKKLFFLTALCVGSLSAMDHDPAEDPNQGNWTASYQTKIGQITHTAECIKLNNAGISITVGNALNMATGSNFNGYIFEKDLALKTNSTQQKFEAQLKSSGLMKK